MDALRIIARHRAHQSGNPWAIVRRPHGISVLPLHLCSNLEILEKIGA